MDIRLFFGSKKNKIKLSEEEREERAKKKIKRKEFLNLITSLVGDNGIIDLLEYSHIMNFHKNGGTLVGMGRFNQIFDKIMKSNKIDDELKLKLDKTTRFVFSHLYKIIKNNNLDNYDSIDVDYITNEIVKNNKDLIDFTKDQKLAIQKICYFLYNPEDSIFSLLGFAGTGKTTVITKLIHYLVRKNYINSIVFAAPTNKAVNVMKSKFRNDIDELLKVKLVEEFDKNISFSEQLDLLDARGVKIDFLTIHKLLNYKNEYDVDGNRVFVKGDKTSLDRYDLVVVDECSMIPIQVVTHIFEDIRNNKKKQVKDSVIKKIPKILFVGDPAQLPPVNERISIIFAKREQDFNLANFKKMVHQEDNYFDSNTDEIIKKRLDALKKDILNLKSITLKHVVRSNSSKVVGLCNDVRSWVLGLVKEPQIGGFKGKKVKLYKYDRDKGSKLNSEWFLKCLEYFKGSTGEKMGSNIILTWTNKQSNKYNNEVRKLILNKKKLNKFEIGDILILTDFYNIEETGIDFNIKGKHKKRFYTSEQIRVVDVDDIIKVSPPFSETLPQKLRRMKNFSDIESKFAKTTNLINKNTNRKYKTWKLYVNKLADVINSNSTQETWKIYIIKKESKELLEKDKEYAAQRIIELRRYMRGVYIDQIKMIDRDVIKPLWREWGRRFVDAFANVDYGNSVTVHKSQGSSFYNVFVDIDDILMNKSNNDAKRCVYTAVTRTSNELHLLI